MALTQDTWIAWNQALGDHGIVRDPEKRSSYEANAAGWTHHIEGVLLPSSTSEVQAAIRIAGQHQATLQPISCGKNWGYNSRLPAERSGTVLLDLSRMNRIRNEATLSETCAVAEIEPGVTQGQLATFLRDRKLPLLFNVTGAGPATSILGNSLERGVGYFGLRTRDISDLEVVLGTGEILRTGAGTLSSDAKTRLHYPFGLGPSLDGLFFQSNLGVVTAAAFRLIPRRPCHVTLIAKLKPDGTLAKFIDALAHLRRQGLIESVPHIGSPNRVRVTLSPLAYRYLVSQGRSPSASLRAEVESIVTQYFERRWTAVAPIFGTANQVLAAREAISSALTPIADVSWITDADLQSNTGLAKAILEPLVQLCQGIPTDGALDSPHWSLGHPLLDDPASLDDSQTGVRFCSPALPLDGELVQWTVDTQKEILAAFDFEPYLTLNIIDDQSALLITNIVFDKSAHGEQSKANEAVHAVQQAWARHGIYPYRLGIDEAKNFPADPIHNSVLSGLKMLFDPLQVLESGRYQRPNEKQIGE